MVAVTTAIREYVIDDPALVDRALRHPALTTLRALEPREPLFGRAKKIMDDLASDQGQSTQTSLLASEDLDGGRDHSHLREPTDEAMAWWLAKPDTTAWIRQTATDSVARLQDLDSPVELVEQVWPFPLTIIRRALGFPHALTDLHQMSRAQTNLLWLIGITEAAQVYGLTAAQHLRNWCTQVVEDHARRLDSDDELDDITSWLLRDGRLSDADIVAVIYGLLIAGHEATAASITNTIYTLLSHPERWNELRPLRGDARESARARIIRHAFHERPGIHTTYRYARRPVTIGDITIRQGARVAIRLWKANRAGAVNGTPYSFGKGPHFCVGAQLALMEVTEYVAAFFRQHNNARLAPEQSYTLLRSAFFLAFERLEVDLAR